MAEQDESVKKPNTFITSGSPAPKSEAIMEWAKDQGMRIVDIKPPNPYEKLFAIDAYLMAKKQIEHARKALKELDIDPDDIDELRREQELSSRELYNYLADAKVTNFVKLETLIDVRDDHED